MCDTVTKDAVSDSGTGKLEFKINAVFRYQDSLLIHLTNDANPLFNHCSLIDQSHFWHV